MNLTASEVCEFVRENDIKFIRLYFCDLFGVPKNISIPDNGLSSAFKNGVSFDAHSVRGFTDITNSDLFLFPDPSTLAVLPWRPGQGKVARFFCDIRTPAGEPFPRDCRYILRNTAEAFKKGGFDCSIGAECEFYLFKTDDDGAPTLKPLDNGGYLDTQPLDAASDIRREICLIMEEMGISPETSHHEQGPGQNEIDFVAGDALTAADRLQTFKMIVKAVAARNGLFASFMPKPVANAAGNGLHINLSLSENSKNIFSSENGGLTAAAESFTAGVLAKACEISLFTNPLANSYERLGSFDAPRYVSWSNQNRSQLIRIPAAKDENARMELRSPDPSANPYLVYALILKAGLYGLQNGLKLPPPVNADLCAKDESVKDKLVKLPENLGEAIKAANGSDFIKSVFDEELLTRYITAKTMEYNAYSASASKQEFSASHYFRMIY